MEEYYPCQMDIVVKPPNPDYWMYLKKTDFEISRLID